MTIDFCVPVRNEEKILATNLIKLRDFIISKQYKFDWQIVVILNNCRDNSENILKRLVKQFPDQIKYLNINPQGKGGALKYYFSISQADILLFMDIDLAVSLINLDDLLQPLIKGQSDLVFGSRLLKNSNVERSFFRSCSSLVYNFLSRKILRHNYRDLQCGFKAFKLEVFSKIKPYLLDDKWFFDTELVLLANFFNYRIAEVPVDWAENRYAQRASAVSVYKDSWSFVKNIIRLQGQLKQLKKTKKYSDNV